MANDDPEHGETVCVLMPIDAQHKKDNKGITKIVLKLVRIFRHDKRPSVPKKAIRKSFVT